VAAVDVPARFVPVGGLRGGQGAVGRTALVDLVPGEVVVGRRLAGLDVQGVAALVPAGRRAVVVPVGEAGVVAHPGDRVDVLATFEADPASGDPTIAVARGALVLDVREGAVTLAVATAEAPRLAFALARATVTLALVPR
jgi:Flp pilus assembly protein CpaB